MTNEDIHQLVSKGLSEKDFKAPELIETHISWVLLFDHFVFKIKKPLRYNFLDFSTLDKRKYFCEREILLNQRLTNDIYLDVQPVKRQSGHLFLGGETGETIDYAVRMNRVDSSRQMDNLLAEGKVTAAEIHKLAKKIALFHKSTDVIYDRDFMAIKNEFDDLKGEQDYLRDQLGGNTDSIISRAINSSGSFVEKHRKLLASRLGEGFFRDGHGDLHSRNIFLLEDPQPFDCIEFNDDFRQIDVLNEIAFLCMDLEAAGYKYLADLFYTDYNLYFSAARSETEKNLFIYYKSYRANIRAKVNSLRAKSAESAVDKNQALDKAKKYLHLMDSYLGELK